MYCGSDALPFASTRYYCPSLLCQLLLDESVCSDTLLYRGLVLLLHLLRVYTASKRRDGAWLLYLSELARYLLRDYTTLVVDVWLSEGCSLRDIEAVAERLQGILKARGVKLDIHDLNKSMLQVECRGGECRLFMLASFDLEVDTGLLVTTRGSYGYLSAKVDSWYIERLFESLALLEQSGCTVKLDLHAKRVAGNRRVIREYVGFTSSGTGMVELELSRYILKYREVGGNEFHVELVSEGRHRYSTHIDIEGTLMHVKQPEGEHVCILP